MRSGDLTGNLRQPRVHPPQGTTANQISLPRDGTTPRYEPSRCRHLPTGLQSLTGRVTAPCKRLNGSPHRTVIQPERESLRGVPQPLSQQRLTPLISERDPIHDRTQLLTRWRVTKRTTHTARTGQTEAYTRFQTGSPSDSPSSIRLLQRPLDSSQ